MLEHIGSTWFILCWSFQRMSVVLKRLLADVLQLEAFHIFGIPLLHREVSEGMMCETIGTCFES